MLYQRTVKHGPVAVPGNSLPPSVITEEARIGKAETIGPTVYQNAVALQKYRLFVCLWYGKERKKECTAKKCNHYRTTTYA
jgi:hypothetical protein